MKYLYLGLASVAAVFAYLAFTVAQLPGSDGLPNGPGYISDEVWYVTSARNILHDVFKTPAASPYFTVGERCLTRGERRREELHEDRRGDGGGARRVLYQEGVPLPG